MPKRSFQPLAEAPEVRSRPDFLHDLSSSLSSDVVDDDDDDDAEQSGRVYLTTSSRCRPDAIAYRRHRHLCHCREALCRKTCCTHSRESLKYP